MNKKAIGIILIVLAIIVGLTFASNKPKTKKTPKVSRKQRIERTLQQEYPSMQRAQAKFENHDYQGAVNDFDEVIQREGDNARIYTLRGRAKARTGDYQGAIDDFNKSLELDPNDRMAKFERERTMKRQYEESQN